MQSKCNQKVHVTHQVIHQVALYVREYDPPRACWHRAKKSKSRTLPFPRIGFPSRLANSAPTRVWTRGNAFLVGVFQKRFIKPPLCKSAFRASTIPLLSHEKCSSRCLDVHPLIPVLSVNHWPGRTSNCLSSLAGTRRTCSTEFIHPTATRGIRSFAKVDAARLTPRFFR
ncbi:hypothetical protein BS17DRAFT_45409 [Gyrodon lividus]|nr:hypothetical protein BS17DRAFT_45409 [Gyrodon lividus]